MNSFSFPFKSNNNNKTSPASAEEFFKALSMETDGFYPFGVNEFWHGGVHITSKSSGDLKQGDGIQCIADGEVVAYRINEKHIDTPAYEAPNKPAVNIPYSSSFTLVRHELVYPAKSKNKLFVFSLYMHLLPWDGYVQATTTPIQYKVTAKNLNMRKDGKGTDVIKGLPGGTIIELSGEKKGSYVQVSKIVSGITPIPETLGWVHKTYIAKLAVKQKAGKIAPSYLGKTVYKVKKSATDEEAFAKGIKGVRGRLKNENGSEVLVLYPQGCELELEAFAKEATRAKVLEIVSGTPKRQAGKTGNGYVWLADLTAEAHPPTFEQVVMPSKTIKKGDLIGYMGQFCTPEMQKDRPMLHWEIFAGDKLKGFIGKARGSNGAAKKAEKTILKIPKGTKLISPNEIDADASLASNAVVVKAKTQGKYTQYTTVANSKKVSRDLLGDWDKAKQYYTPKKESYADLTKLLGQTVDKSSHFPLLKQHDGKDRTIQIPQVKSETLWVKKSSGLIALKNNKHLVTSTSDAWTKYPESFETEITQVEEDFCMNLSEVKNKKQDEAGNDWNEVMLTQNNVCTLGYIDSSKFGYHTPEEFICFNGSDVKGGSDASIHKDADTHWKKLFTPITLENSENDETSPDSDFRLTLHPFAKEVFKYMDANHDGTITLTEVQNAQKDPHKQKKIGQLITKHESEWVESMDRWKYVEKYIPDATRYDWDHEKARIKKLAWWDEVKGKVDGFPADEAYYLHPVGFVGNFASGKIYNKEYIVDIIPKSKKHRSGSAMTPTTLTIHSTGNPTSVAKGERGWLTNPTNVRTASFHIVVDQYRAIECIPFTEVAWHAGDRAGNTTSIGLEICESGDRAATLENAIRLTAQILFDRGWNTSNLKMHNDWSGKNCPRILRTASLRTAPHQSWEWFIQEVGKYV